MLDMFKRDTDPPEYYQYYTIPAATLIGGYAYATATGSADMTQLMQLASAMCCIGGIGGLASQKTARLGNALGGWVDG